MYVVSAYMRDDAFQLYRFAIAAAELWYPDLLGLFPVSVRSVPRFLDRSLLRLLSYWAAGLLPPGLLDTGVYGVLGSGVLEFRGSWIFGL